MPPKKTSRPDAPVVETPAVETPAVETPVNPEPQTKPVKRVHAVKDAMHHPFQKRWIGVETEGIEVTLDSWVECQIEAGYLEEVVVE